jgi:hypothetical protein
MIKPVNVACQIRRRRYVHAIFLDPAESPSGALCNSPETGNALVDTGSLDFSAEIFGFGDG